MVSGRRQVAKRERVNHFDLVRTQRPGAFELFVRISTTQSQKRVSPWPAEILSFDVLKAYSAGSVLLTS